MIASCSKQRGAPGKGRMREDGESHHGAGGHRVEFSGMHGGLDENGFWDSSTGCLVGSLGQSVKEEVREKGEEKLLRKQLKGLGQGMERRNG